MHKRWNKGTKQKIIREQGNMKYGEKGAWLNFARKQGNKAKIFKATREPNNPPGRPSYEVSKILLLKKVQNSV